MTSDRSGTTGVCAGCNRAIDPAFDVQVVDNLGRPWHTICMTRARGATGNEDQVRGAGPLWAWAIVTLILPFVGLIAGLVYLFRNKIGPGLALIIEAVVLFAIYALLLSSASADVWTAPQQESAAPGVDVVTAVANRYWDARGVPKCPEVETWTAPTLDPYDSWGDTILGRGENCNIWLTDYSANFVIDPNVWQTAVYGCAVVVHEVGHARGLPHSPDGVMMATLDQGHLGRWVPAPCVGWGRSFMRSLLEGDGDPDSLVRRKLARGYNPRAFKS